MRKAFVALSLFCISGLIILGSVPELKVSNTYNELVIVDRINDNIPNDILIKLIGYTKMPYINRGTELG